AVDVVGGGCVWGAWVWAVNVATPNAAHATAAKSSCLMLILLCGEMVWCSGGDYALQSGRRQACYNRRHPAKDAASGVKFARSYRLKNPRLIFLGAVVLWLVAAASGVAQRPSPPLRPAPSSAHTPSADVDHNAVVRRYCVTCHNDKLKTGGLSLASFDVAHAAERAAVTEAMI